jgi:hypothetical protein
MAEKVGKDQPEGRDYCVSIFGYVPPNPKESKAIQEKKAKNPQKYHFADDYKWFVTEQDAADFVKNKHRVTEYLHKTKLWKTLIERFNNNLPFYQIVGVIVKKKQMDGRWMYLLKHEKEISIKGFKKQFSSEKIVEVEDKAENPDALSASVIKTSYSK